MLLFARYAYPPNELGYCGPADSRALLEYGATGTVDPGLTQLARSFTGPWPYLTVIAGAAGITDPFDPRVVEAYWLGNHLLDRVGPSDFARAVEDRLKPLAGRQWGLLTEAFPAGARPTHAFHVFGVYPWVGLLASGRVDSEHPLHVLDRCRIRWGRVVEVEGSDVTVTSRPLIWTGTRLVLGSPRQETATRTVDGLGFVDRLRPGHWVALHWGWVCDRLDERQLANLRRHTLRQLRLTNREVAHSGPGMAMSG